MQGIPALQNKQSKVQCVWDTHCQKPPAKTQPAGWGKSLGSNGFQHWKKLVYFLVLTTSLWLPSRFCEYSPHPPGSSATSPADHSRAHKAKLISTCRAQCISFVYTRTHPKNANIVFLLSPGKPWWTAQLFILQTFTVKRKITIPHTTASVLPVSHWSWPRPGTVQQNLLILKMLQNNPSI